MFFNTATENNLFCLDSFSAKYLLSTETVLHTGDINSSVSFKTKSKIEFKQEVQKKRIISSIELLNICGEASHPHNVPHLNQALVFAEMSPYVVFERAMDGKIKNVANPKRIKSDWQKWKREKMPIHITDKAIQNKFTRNVEAGLSNMNQIKNNTTYLLIMPPLFDLPKYPNGTLDIKNIGVWESRFVENFYKNYHYKVKQVKVSEVVGLKFAGVDFSDLSNSFFIKSFYQQYLSNHDPASYKVQIVGDYKLEQATGKILEGNLIQVEQFNQNFYYEIFNKLTIIA